jgi:hypothetical protein
VLRGLSRLASDEAGALEGEYDVMDRRTVSASISSGFFFSAGAAKNSMPLIFS